MRLLASIVVVPVLFVGWQLWSDHSLEQRLKPVASGISGRSVDVDCQSLWGALLDAQGREGQVYFDGNGTPERELFLTRRICNRLRAFDGTTTTPRARLPEGDRLDHPRPAALLVGVLRPRLAHDLRDPDPCARGYHTAGSRGEAETNCFAIQAMAWTAIQLGAPPGRGGASRPRDGGARARPGVGVRNERMPPRPPPRPSSRDGRLPHGAPDRRTRGTRQRAVGCRRDPRQRRHSHPRSVASDRGSTRDRRADHRRRRGNPRVDAPNARTRRPRRPVCPPGVHGLTRALPDLGARAP